MLVLALAAVVLVLAALAQVEAWRGHPFSRRSETVVRDIAALSLLVRPLGNLDEAGTNTRAEATIGIRFFNPTPGERKIVGASLRVRLPGGGALDVPHVGPYPTSLRNSNIWGRFPGDGPERLPITIAPLSSADEEQNQWDWVFVGRVFLPPMLVNSTARLRGQLRFQVFGLGRTETTVSSRLELPVFWNQATD
jgi:hypothetical protein